MLQYRDVQVSYNKQVVLDHFSLQLGKGEIVALVGESGSGKTTAVRAAMGLLPKGGTITEGDILLGDASLVTMKQKERDGLMGRELSMIFQDSGSMLNPVRTVGSQFTEMIREHEKKISKREAYAKALEQLQKVGLPHEEMIMKSIPGQLSGGMRQRVGVAMAMTYTPQVLLADEPTSALDVTIQAQIVKMLINLCHEYGTSILLVTHNLAVASYIADRILVMKDGYIVEEGDSNTLLKNPKQDYTRELVEAIPDIKKSYHGKRVG